MTIAMSCVTSAPHHEDIIPHISPLFASIPELQSVESPDTAETSSPVHSGQVANSDTLPADSSNVAGTSCSVGCSDTANSDTPGNPATPNCTSGVCCKDPSRLPVTSGYVLNMAPVKLHSAVPMLSALGSSFYDISSQLSLNLSPTSQVSSLSAVPTPYAPSPFISDPYDPLPFPEEVDYHSIQKVHTTPSQPCQGCSLQKVVGPR